MSGVRIPSGPFYLKSKSVFKGMDYSLLFFIVLLEELADSCQDARVSEHPVSSPEVFLWKRESELLLEPLGRELDIYSSNLVREAW